MLNMHFCIELLVGGFNTRETNSSGCLVEPFTEEKSEGTWNSWSGWHLGMYYFTLTFELDKAVCNLSSQLLFVDELWKSCDMFQRVVTADFMEL